MVDKVRHPSCVQVFDVGVDDTNDPFLVMELLDGPAVAEVLDQSGELLESEESVALVD